MQNKSLNQTQKSRLLKAHEKIVLGLETVQKGCRDYVAVLDENSEAVRSLMRARGVSEDFLDLMERVGRGYVHHRLLFIPGPGAERLQRVPYSEQERLLNAGVEVVHLVGDEMKVTVKPVMELSRSEAEVCLDSQGNVSREIQAERLKERLMTKTFSLPPYKLQADELIVRRDTRIPFAELERLYNEAASIHAGKKARLQEDMKRRQIEK